MFDQVRMYQECIDEGVKLKRAGLYREAIEKYKRGIAVYPENPEIFDIFVALGKVFYLEGEYAKAKNSYEIAVLYVMLRQPDLQIDLLKLIDGALDERSRIEFVRFVEYYGRHIGHAMEDKYSMNRTAVNEYTNAIAGKGNSDMVKSYEEKCTQIGKEEINKLFVKWYENLMSMSNNVSNVQDVSYRWLEEGVRQRLHAINFI